MVLVRFAMPFIIRHAACWQSPSRLSGVTHLKNPPHMVVDTYPICSTIPLGSLHNQHLDPAPPHCLHPFPIPRQNNNATQKLVLKEDNVLLHLRHLLIKVAGDVQASQKRLFIPAMNAKP